MKLDIRIRNGLDQPNLQQTVTVRTATALTRLVPKLGYVSLSLSPVTRREGGETECRISARLSRGGTVQVKSSDAEPVAAAQQAVERLRRAVLRECDRRAKPANRASIRRPATWHHMGEGPRWRSSAPS